MGKTNTNHTRNQKKQKQPHTMETMEKSKTNQTPQNTQTHIPNNQKIPTKQLRIHQRNNNRSTPKKQPRLHIQQQILRAHIQTRQHPTNERKIPQIPNNQNALLTRPNSSTNQIRTQGLNPHCRNDHNPQ